MIVLKHVQYIEFAYGMKHYQKWNEALSKGTCDTTHFENYSLQKKLEVPQLLDQIKRKHAF